MVALGDITSRRSGIPLTYLWYLGWMCACKYTIALTKFTMHWKLWRTCLRDNKINRSCLSSKQFHPGAMTRPVMVASHILEGLPRDFRDRLRGSTCLLEAHSTDGARHLTANWKECEGTCGRGGRGSKGSDGGWFWESLGRYVTLGGPRQCCCYSGSTVISSRWRSCMPRVLLMQSSGCGCTSFRSGARWCCR